MLPPETDNIMIDEDPPTIEEFDKTTKKMKNGRCKDPTNIFA